MYREYDFWISFYICVQILKKQPPPVINQNKINHERIMSTVAHDSLALHCTGSLQVNLKAQFFFLH